MAWLKIDDGFPNHPKIDPLSDAAFRLHVTGMCFCSQNLTDGFLSNRQAQNLAATLGGDESIEKLAAAGVWHRRRDGSGWEIHDYLGYNPSKKQVAELREKRQRAGKAGGRTSSQASARASDGRFAQASASGGVPSSPSPSPSPSPSQSHLRKDKDPESADARKNEPKPPPWSKSPPVTEAWKILQKKFGRTEATQCLKIAASATIDPSVVLASAEAINEHNDVESPRGLWTHILRAKAQDHAAEESARKNDELKQDRTPLTTLLKQIGKVP